MKHGWKNRLAIAWTVSFAAILAFSGCGRQEFAPVSNEVQSQAPGNFVIPPKVDILLVEDDTGSMSEILEIVSKQMPIFLAGLEGRRWDYHFATIPLTTDRPVTQVIASKFDGNWGSLWTPPYPGANQIDSTEVSPSVFTKPENYTGFISKSDVSNARLGDEPGLETIRLAFADRLAGTGFLRDDALLVVVIVGNGNDTSGITYCTRSDGVTIPCGSTATTSLNYYKSQFQALKPSSNQIKFVAAVANQTSCLGSYAYLGTRYQELATTFKGPLGDNGSFDICSQPIPMVLDALSSSLQGLKIGMRTRYLFVERDADPSTLVVTKYIGGDRAKAVTIPQDATNGWTYAGYQQNIHVIDYPISMNLASGYAIELHGTAKLTGDDTASISFTGAGTQVTGQ